MSKLRVCFVATEMRGMGPYGGFGSLTRDIAGGLAARGLDMYVALPRNPGQKPVEIIDGIKVVSYPSQLYRGAREAIPFAGVYRMIDADIYHSQEPSVGTYLAQKSVPEKTHVVTFQDPRDFLERDEGLGAPIENLSWIRYQKRRLTFKAEYYRINKAVNKADALFCQAWYAIPKAMKLYGLKSKPRFLPNPVEVPRKTLSKAKDPTICFLGRWDPRKRPELFFELAGRFPGVKCVAMGGCDQGRPQRDKDLREKYGNVSNLTMLGWAGGKSKAAVLGESWILVNTSWRECLPVTYLEACAYKCAILSHENPDDFASKFGHWAQKGDIEDFSRGLETLLEGNRWRNLGEDGYEYVRSTHEFEKVINDHIRVYEEIT